LVVATAFAVAGVGGLILDQVRAARAEGRRFTDELGWTLLWALGLSVLFIAAWLLGADPIGTFGGKSLMEVERGEDGGMALERRRCL
jgi:hypothetical protein